VVLFRPKIRASASELPKTYLSFCSAIVSLNLYLLLQMDERNTKELIALKRSSSARGLKPMDSGDGDSDVLADLNVLMNLWMFKWL